MPSISSHNFNLVVIGGGPAGFMGAINAAEEGVESVLILEASSKPLEKVLISGGGRCNVTNACWDPCELVLNYPRGKLPLFTAFSRFCTGDAVEWFSNHGVELNIEMDGRMFPSSNSSIEVVNCLRRYAKNSGVKVYTKSAVKSLESLGKEGFIVVCRNGLTFRSKKVLLATGGHPSGYRLAKDLGHKCIFSVPSLFTLSLDAPWLSKCAGFVLDDVHMSLNIDGQRYNEAGTILITHWGLSGPAVLRLTSFAARSLHSKNYIGSLNINWLGNFDLSSVKSIIASYRYKKPRSLLGSERPFHFLSKRFWLSILKQIGVNPSLRWADLPRDVERCLSEALCSSNYLISGRGKFGEEFVTAGGVDLSEVNLENMESRHCKGLFFAGELLNVDGVTGGFNFQHCWSTGWLAGKGIASSIK